MTHSRHDAYHGLAAPLDADRRLFFRRTRQRLDMVAAIVWAIVETWRILNRAANPAASLQRHRLRAPTRKAA